MQKKESPTQELSDQKEDHQYIEPKNIELTLSQDQREKCRKIVFEINRFGVSQREKLFICGLLSLELEDLEARNAFTDAVKIARSKLKEELKLEPTPKKKLII